MNRVIIHTAMEHFANSFRSLALKWSNHGGICRFLGADALVGLKNELVSSPSEIWGLSESLEGPGVCFFCPLLCTGLDMTGTKLHS